MERTFITMHDLSSEARIEYASESILDILGYHPSEVLGLSCFDFFHPEELPQAKKIHTRGIHLDKAAVLVYCQVKHKNGTYVNCESIWSVVYDVFVAATSLHIQTSKSQGRALTAPVIRRVFSSSPNDPRYHMLTHLSTKFRMQRPNADEQHEPRTAFLINRFTKTAAILYASSAVDQVFGLTPGEVVNKSLYECVDEDCLQNVVDAIERAKENDSIAYLRFRWRDPRTPEPAAEALNEPQPPPSIPEPQPPTGNPIADEPLVRPRRSTRLRSKRGRDDEQPEEDSGASSRRANKRRKAVAKAIEMTNPANKPIQGRESRAGPSQPRRLPELSMTGEQTSMSNGQVNQQHQRPLPPNVGPPEEVEAVVSATSDGLVVILRKARPLIPKPLHDIRGGVYASPWAPTPLVPPVGNATTRDNAFETTFMEAIRETAVFAWSLRDLGGEVVFPENEPADSDLNGVPQKGKDRMVNGEVDGVDSELSLTSSLLSKTSNFLSNIKSSLLPSSSSDDMSTNPDDLSLGLPRLDPSPALSSSGTSTSISGSTDTSRSKSNDTQATEVTPVNSAEGADDSVSDQLKSIAEDVQKDNSEFAAHHA